MDDLEMAADVSELLQIIDAVAAAARHDGLSSAVDGVVAWSRTRLGTATADRPWAAYLLGVALQLRALDSGKADDFHASVEQFRAAVAEGPDDPFFPRYLTELGAALHQIGVETREVDPLDEAVEVLRRAVAVTADGHPHLATRVAGYGTALCQRGLLLASATDLDLGVDLLRHATGIAHPDDPRRGWYHSRLAIGLMMRFQHGTDPRDADEAYAMFKVAAHLAQPYDPRGLSYLRMAFGARRARRRPRAR